MRRLKHNFKKGMAFVLSLAMVAGLVPAMSGGANTVQAATGSGTEPSVSAYATKTQLMDGTFKPGADGTATNYGKLVLGKNSSGGAQEWYILGKDEGVSGDNTIIFAASPIATNQVFNSSISNKTFDSSFGVYASNPSEVFANHYGASDLRVTLQGMATNISYFTTAEQGLMNPTTVTTKDTMNSATYTTTDKLYALAADGYGSSHTTIKAGSGDSTVLAMNIYWSNGSRFWLRSPIGNYGSYALFADPGVSVDYAFDAHERAVQPASNLNLSSVLFASAAMATSSNPAELGTIALDKAMTLRLDGTGKDIGTVTYNATTGDIEVARGGTSQPVSLVVQGNDGVNDWYYSKQITGPETINASAIKTALSMTSDIDLSACKIWLEITDTDGLAYAVGATEAGIVGAPTANPTAGAYTENQSVALASSTVGATIYYTTDGSEPTILSGVPSGTTKEYTAPIAVTGTEGQSSTTTIKAIAVNNGMQDSSVETFTYTIQIPVAKYTVTVTNGSGTGQYAQGETVTIIAGAAPSGQQFKEWEVVSGTITLASSTSETTTFTMPTEAVSVKANYEAIPVTGYTITATAGANGSITPSGAVGVVAGGSQTFTISPSSGYVIDTLKVDGLEVTATTSYTFSEVNSNHTIEVNFKQESQTPNVPDVTAPSITTQPGNATVKVGETATFTIAVNGTDLTYQWQIDRNDGNGWVNIDGATAASYTTSTVDISCNGFKYQCVVSNSAGTDTSNTAVLTVTENTTPAPGSVDYEILDGANTSWEQNSDGSLSIRGSGAISKFVGVKVDGNLVDAKNYTVKEGSTIVTLKADYLNTLSVGNHTFEIIWTDGTASTRFAVSKSDSGSAEPKDNDGNNGKNDNTNNTPATVPEDKNNNGTSGSQTDDNQQITAPKTGDNSHTVLWISLLGVSLAGLLSMIYVRKKKENK